MNTYLQYPFDKFWVSDKTRTTLTLGTMTEFQEIMSPGNGTMEVIGKDEVMLSYRFKQFKLDLVLYPMQSYKLEEIKKGSPIGFALDNHLEIRAIKHTSSTYEVNPLTVLFVHWDQMYTSAVPYATPKLLTK